MALFRSVAKFHAVFYNGRKGKKCTRNLSPIFAAQTPARQDYIEIMQIKLQRINEAVRFEGINAAGNTVIVEGSPDIGGEGQGMRPMELLLVSLASCSSMDAVSILKKMRQPLEDFRVEIEGEREKDAVPAVFVKIKMHFILKGQLRPERVEEALRLAVDKYCSVGRMLEQTAEIAWDYSIENGASPEESSPSN